MIFLRIDDRSVRKSGFSMLNNLPHLRHRFDNFVLIKRKYNRAWIDLPNNKKNIRSWSHTRQLALSRPQVAPRCSIGLISIAYSKTEFNNGQNVWKLFRFQLSEQFCCKGWSYNAANLMLHKASFRAFSVVRPVTLELLSFNWNSLCVLLLHFSRLPASAVYSTLHKHVGITRGQKWLYAGPIAE